MSTIEPVYLIPGIILRRQAMTCRLPLLLCLPLPPPAGPPARQLIAARLPRPLYLIDFLMATVVVGPQHTFIHVVRCSLQSGRNNFAERLMMEYYFITYKFNISLY